ncbi:MAG: phage tail protein, partial [Pseudomonadota bacterium]
EIAQTWRGASAASAPAETLDWLASWLGAAVDPALGEVGKRQLIGGAAEQSLWHGTLRGLEEALDIATNGGVRSARVVVLENFMIQRTLATILGADFDDTFDPLTRGTRRNAHSHLGTDFVLGRGDERAFFALFRPTLLSDPLTTADERADALAALQDMEEATAFKVTVLVHNGTSARERGLIRAVLEREVPAHVQADIFDAPQSLLMGLTALLGVETRLGPPITKAALRLGETPLGQAWMQDLPSLDPRLEP